MILDYQRRNPDRSMRMEYLQLTQPRFSECFNQTSPSVTINDFPVDLMFWRNKYFELIIQTEVATYDYQPVYLIYSYHGVEFYFVNSNGTLENYRV